MRARWLATTSARESPDRGRIFSTFGGATSGRRREPRERRFESVVSCSAAIPTQFSSESESKYKHVSSRLSRYARGFNEKMGFLKSHRTLQVRFSVELSTLPP